MDDSILISNLNDFLFCPVSIYFHNLYGNEDRLMYQSAYQINGTKAHESVDNNTYSTRKNIITAMDVYSERYKLVGKIDIYDENKKLLVERKKHVTAVYDGFVFQMYAQYYALEEMGYEVKRMEIRSIDDNKHYMVKLPTHDAEKNADFERLVDEIRIFTMNDFCQTNIEKCRKCIYADACDRSAAREG